MIDIHTDPDDSGHDSKFIFDETIDYSAPRFRGQVNPNNLTKWRWRAPILLPGEVADLLRATKGPEPAASAAKNTLFKAFHRLVLKEAKRYCRDDGRNDDLIAAGMLGLAEAIDRFNLNRNNGFAAYALPYIRKRLKDASKAFNRNGWAGETRLQRLVYGDRDVTPERASEVMGRPVDQDEIERARAEVLGMCSEIRPYDTREPGREDDDDEERKPGVVLPAAAPPCAVQRYATLTMYRGQLLWTAAGLHLYGLAHDADRRATQRLKKIGRRAYALELVAKTKRPIEHLFEPRRRLTAPSVNSCWTADKPAPEPPPLPMPTLFTLMRGGWQPFAEPELWPRGPQSDGQWSVPGTESYRRWRSIYPTWCGQPAPSTSAASPGLQQYEPAALALAA
jgi:RNA polymerase sigma factor (sigma-70 family)